MINTLTSYQLIASNMDRSIERVEAQPTVKRETEYYLANIGNVTSIEEFVEDDRLFNYAMKAHGLSDMAYAKAFMVKALEEGLSDSDSFANKLTDKRYAEFVKSFNFADLGESATRVTAAMQGTVDKYTRQTLEEDAGSQNEGVRLALYFERKSDELTSWFQVLADPALAQVVRVSLGLPDSFAQSDLDKQVQFFESRMDIEDLADPEELSKFITRFTSMWELSNPTTPQLGAASLILGQPIEFGISSDVLFTLAQMKR